MALKARDSKHQNQINAGTNGRLLGHSFEKLLSENINKYANDLIKSISQRNSQEYLVTGVPEQILIQYIVNNLQLEKIKSIKSFWLGGLATSGQGDVFDILGDGKSVKRSKSDILIEINSLSGVQRVGVSVKTCNKEKPTNAQLFCSTAHAFCELLRSNKIPASSDFEKGLMMFCGEDGFRPLDDKKALVGRRSDPERWFFEELPRQSRNDIESTIKKYQDQITRALLQLAYREDPCPPDFVFHQTRKAENPKQFPAAIFHMNELIKLSREYNGFSTREYQVRKGRFKGDPNIHLAPRFGCIQFQRLGNKQNATQLQFNLEAGYFHKITAPSE